MLQSMGSQGVRQDCVTEVKDMLFRKSFPTGGTCTPVADSCQCMNVWQCIAKTTTIL